MFHIDEGKNVGEIVRQLQQYVVNSGFDVKENYEDTSPYFILGGGTGIGYRTRSKWGWKGIVFFCTAEDREIISTRLGLPVYENAKKKRPYAIFIPINKFEEAVELLKENPLN